MEINYLDPIFLLPIIAAFIGWLTNYIAVKMLFRPKEEVRFFFFRIQGVFPKRQHIIAKRLGDVVSKELFSADDVKLAIKRGAESGVFSGAIKQEIKKFVEEKLPIAFPILQAMMSPELVSKVTDVIEGELGSILATLTDSFSGDLDSILNVQEIVEEKVNAFSSEKLEDMLFAIMKKEFKFIEFVGAVLGFFIGVVQIILIKWEAFYQLITNLL